MKTTFYLFLCFMTLALQSAGQNCAISPVLYKHYKDDINMLTVKEMWAKNTDTDKIFVNNNIAQEIGEGMSAIFSSTFPERDTIFDQYCIHDTTFVSVNKSILIFFDDTYSWTAKWIKGSTVTGVALIDGLFSRHNLRVVKYHSFPNLSVFFRNCLEVESPEVINMDALIDSLILANGINQIDRNEIINVSGKLAYSKILNDRYYEFKFEWNDCFDGCDNSRKWTFKVDPLCKVTYTGAVDWGYFKVLPLPTPSNCNITKLGLSVSNQAVKTLAVYPVPAENYININNIPFNADFSIYDLSGRLLKEVESNTNSLKIDITEIPAGAYVIKSKKLNYHRKITKDSWQ